MSIPPPFKNYIGAKNADGTFQTIINHIPPHDNYFELYLGTGAILRKKKPAAGINLGCDIDSKVISKWQKISNKLPANFYIKNCSASSVLQFLDLIKGTNFLYLDPPYPIESIKSKNKIYKHSMTLGEHEELLDLIINKSDTGQGNILFMVSTYNNSLYANKLKKWTCISYQAITNSGEKATELLYMNYAIPAALHEYTYLGKDFREREKIKRAKNNLVKKISSYPTSQKLMILQTLKNEFDL